MSYSSIPVSSHNNLVTFLYRGKQLFSRQCWRKLKTLTKLFFVGKAQEHQWMCVQCKPWRFQLHVLQAYYKSLTTPFIIYTRLLTCTLVSIHSKIQLLSQGKILTRLYCAGHVQEASDFKTSSKNQTLNHTNISSKLDNVGTHIHLTVFLWIGKYLFSIQWVRRKRS
jgi:hypothetical protein